MLFRAQQARIRIIPFLLCLGSAVPGFAVDKTWNTADGDWSNPLKWTPNGVPIATDHAFIGTAPGSADASVFQDLNATLGALDLVGRGRLYTEGFRLTVNGQTRIAGTGTPGIPDTYARLTVENSPSATDFRSGSILLDSAAELQLQATPNVVVDGAMSLKGHALLTGNGAVNVGGNFSNDGTLAPSGFTMTLAVSGLMDLDGTTGNGGIWFYYPDSYLTIIADGFTDVFDGDIGIGGNCSLNVVVPGGWVTGPGSEIQVTAGGPGGQTSDLFGSDLTIGGGLSLPGGPSASDTLRIGGSTTFESTAHVAVNGNALELVDATSVHGATFGIGPDGTADFNAEATVTSGTFTLGQDSVLAFNGPTTISGGNFATASDAVADGHIRFSGPTTWNGSVTVDGAARQLGDATVTGNTAINIDTFDMDGGGNTTWNIQANCVINAETIEAALGNVFDGTLNIAGGLLARLTLNLSDPNATWGMGGVLNLTGDNTLFPTRVAGSPLDVTGTVNVVSGKVRINSDTTFANASTLNIGPAAAILQMSGDTFVSGATMIAGQGTLQCSPTGTLLLADDVTLGTVGLVNQGRLDIATGPGLVAVDRFTNATNGTWHVEIGGPLQGAEHDALLVTDDAALAGTLTVDLLENGGGPFLPAIGDEFTILTAAGGVSGTFAKVRDAHALGYSYIWDALYGSNTVTLKLTAVTPTLGDMNCDGRVDFADIDPFVTALGGAVAYAQHFPECRWLNADTNGDGLVTFADIDPFVALLGS